jgi:putative transposase
MTHTPSGRLYHNTPPWVPDTAVFHIRVRASRRQQTPLTDPELAGALVDSIHEYAARNRWSCFLAVLLPDHLHMLLSFGRVSGMITTVTAWKGYHARVHRIAWQKGFFDHRLRNAAEYSEKYGYILRNPVALELCASPEEWPWTTCAFADQPPPGR